MVHFFFSPVIEKLNVRKADCFQGVVIFLQGDVWMRMEATLQGQQLLNSLGIRCTLVRS